MTYILQFHDNADVICHFLEQEDERWGPTNPYGGENTNPQLFWHCYPVIIVIKKDRKPQLNQRTVKDPYPMPNVEDGLNCLQGSKFQSKFDFVCACGYALRTNALALFQRGIDEIFGQWRGMSTQDTPSVGVHGAVFPSGRTSFTRDLA
ncbi:hypothetical protein QOT17_014544 [Balamuthia mandrillaris]